MCCLECCSILLLGGGVVAWSLSDLSALRALVLGFRMLGFPQTPNMGSC